MNYGIFQTKNLPPRVDGKGNQTHYRFLFREQKSPDQQHDTVTVFCEEEHVESVVKQGLAQLPVEVRERILEGGWSEEENRQEVG